ncbi:ectonucleoside triphosphate diphosphohydrolase 8 [Callorhinchus milii]|uniref:Ectonucleoside triphosphate diphosphohydrolase 8 n=1 Tax=Callorhinchus milii TaxID=7868 RepID=A0A4W3IZL7_CALMI|nr:ectonucleoside triphosphate diphosphohydrolase 8 [Callorhinchus milii]XP_007898393.1 ectonucleoside triphosphate diphosphohydrolase 8 [Callorhinchus milii]XP_007898394.1 ectonucleoside triphosphate diphosphohydrolase 8 [Callorhinchus milii]XP_007898395.1 ectonucleoside triphosphate diphosphohydrolase 8 [Callorhinchus milii]|eukprot:gi/632964429/ref/XP_007898392.1/ PREDICTED: ectonucleoside triphosphate diphosphohydrolase 8 [Callorhinchus milii]
MKLSNTQFITRGLIAFVITSGIIALILSLVGIQEVQLPPGRKYGMVFDAGSTHTSIFLYHWPADEQNGTGIVSQLHHCEVNGPGISGYAENPPKAGESLRPCLDNVSSYIPVESQKETIIYLGATAGMRLLKIQNETKSDMILEEVSKTIKSYPFKFQGARIISGMEEGAYGWTTINYLLNSFIKYSFDGKWTHPESANIHGALDLGGASTQITFTPKESIEDKTTDVRFKLYGYNYIIYTHSYLCYGQQHFKKKHIAMQLQGKNLTDLIEIPCYLKGFKSNMTLDSIFDSPCTSDQKPLPYDGTQIIALVGTGKPGECREAVKTLFNFTACGGSQTCAFDGVYQPPINGPFFAFSAFFYTFDFFNLTSGNPSLSTVNKTIKEFCSREWQEVKASYPKQKVKYLQNYCLSATQIYTLLVDAYNFDSRTWNNIIFQQKADNTEIGWTLGYMLNLTNIIPSEIATILSGQPKPLWSASVFFIGLTVAMALAMAGLLLLRRGKSAV